MLSRYLTQIEGENKTWYDSSVFSESKSDGYKIRPGPDNILDYVILCLFCPGGELIGYLVW